jgi:hypothetical protein
LPPSTNKIQQALRAASGAAWTEIVAIELFGQLDIAMNDTLSNLPTMFARDHHYRSRCPSGKSPMGLVQSFRQKYSASELTQITPTTPAIPHP